MSRRRGKSKAARILPVVAVVGIAGCLVAMRKGRLGALRKACERCGCAPCRCEKPSPEKTEEMAVAGGVEQ